MSFPEIFNNAPFDWFLLGLLLAVLELIIPGFVIIFFAFGAWLLALITLVFDISLALQIILFVVASVSSLILLRKRLKSRFFREKVNASSNQDNEFIGKKVMVTEAISPGKNGKVEYKGANWSAKSDVEIGSGAMVEIVGQESICLIVKPI